jgi:hypothetical protein
MRGVVDDFTSLQDPPPSPLRFGSGYAAMDVRTRPQKAHREGTAVRCAGDGSPFRVGRRIKLQARNRRPFVAAAAPSDSRVQISRPDPEPHWDGTAGPGVAVGVGTPKLRAWMLDSELSPPSDALLSQLTTKTPPGPTASAGE